MPTPPDFEARYRADDLPWETGRHDHALSHLVERGPIQPCRMLEIGCGVGTNALWLAGRGFEVSAVDVSPTAIDEARARAAQAELRVDFQVADVMNGGLAADPFALVFDRGCFHLYDDPSRREHFAAVVRDQLVSGGRWLSLLGSTDGRGPDPGPPRRSALEIASAVEERFEILRLETYYLDTRLPEAPRAWVCLMRKRG